MAPRLMSSITTNESVHLSVAPSMWFTVYITPFSNRHAKTNEFRSKCFVVPVLELLRVCGWLVLVEVMCAVSDISMFPLRSCRPYIMSVLQQEVFLRQPQRDMPARRRHNYTFSAMTNTPHQIERINGFCVPKKTPVKWGN